MENKKFLSEFDDYLKVLKMDEEDYFKDLEQEFNYLKRIDVDKYNIDYDKKQTSIEKEVLAWKKYRRNNYQKAELREFEPFLTRGEIADFILQQTRLFDKDNNIISFDNMLDEGANKLIKDLLKGEITKIRRAKNKFDAIENSVSLYNKINDKMTDSYSKDTFLENLRGFILDASTKNTAEQVYETLMGKLPSTIQTVLRKGERQALVEFLFGEVTDFERMNTSDIDFLLKRKWVSFVKNKFFNEEGFITSDDVFDTVLSAFKDIKNDFKASNNVFKFNFKNSLRKAVSKRITPFQFNAEIRSLVRDSTRQAFRSGIMMFGLDPKDFSIVEGMIVSRINNITRIHLSKMTSAIYNNTISLSQALLKSESWSNKLLKKAYDLALLTADADGLYEWIYGDTKHCPSCLSANGQRHRLKAWHASGILPQSNGSKELLCGGFYCKCKLVRVTGKATGRLDRIRVK